MYLSLASSDKGGVQVYKTESEWWQVFGQLTRWNKSESEWGQVYGQPTQDTPRSAAQGNSQRMQTGADSRLVTKRLEPKERRFNSQKPHNAQ